MYNLMVGFTGLDEGRASLGVGRIFEYTQDEIRDRFMDRAAIRVEHLAHLPCLVMDEGDGDGIARVARITQITAARNEVQFEFAFEQGIPSLTNRQINARMQDFGMNQFEFSRTHWAVKDNDLYRAIIRAGRIERSKPTIFQIAEPEAIGPRQISVMMPFDGTSAGVYDAIREMAQRNGLQCNRGDDIWKHDVIIQDVVSLIDKSRIVICDLSGKNPNVFYETGIAHALGRQTILITQNRDDVPFDLRHIRYVTYHNNGEGRTELVAKIEARIAEIYGA